MRKPSWLHDHFDGTAHCRDCEGPCRLAAGSPELMATALARVMCERAAFNGESGLTYSEAMTLDRFGVDPDAMFARAQEAFRRAHRARDGSWATSVQTAGSNGG